MGSPPPKYQSFGVLDHHRPRRLLLVDFQRAHDVRHDDLGGTGRVVSRGVDKAMLRHIHHAAHQVLAVVQLAGTLPAIGSGKGTGGTIGLADPFQLTGDEVESLVPAHPDEIAAPPGFHVGTCPLLEEGPAHHGIANARRRVDRVPNPRELVCRTRILFPGADRNPAAIFDLGPKGTPMGGRENLATCHFGESRPVQKQGMGK